MAYVEQSLEHAPPLVSPRSDEQEDSPAASDEEDEEAEASETASKASAAFGHVRTPVHSEVVDVSRRSAWSKFQLPMPTAADLPVLARRGAFFLVACSLVAVATVGLATGCEEAPPLGRFCVAEGDVQWAVAFAPACLALLGFLCWLRRRKQIRKEASAIRYRQDAEAQQSAVELLDALLDSPPSEISKYAQQVVQILKERTYRPEFHGEFEDFPDKAAVQHRGWLAVEAVCRADRTQAAKIQALGVVPVLLASLEEHRRVRQVQKAGLAALSCLSKVARQQIFDQGGIPNVVAAMAKFRRDGDVQLGGAMALGGLCVASDACAISAAKYGGISVMTAALERHAKRPDVLIAVSETLALIASTRKEDILQRMMPALPPLRSLLAQHADASTRESEGELLRPALRRAGEATLAEYITETTDDFFDQLLGSAKEKPTLTDDDDWSEVGTPRQNAQKSVVKAAQDEAKQAADLTDRFKRWNDRRKG
eukprot:s342_g4.t2